MGYLRCPGLKPLDDKDRQSEWVESTPIGDLFLRFTPFMKVYLEYVKDYDSRLTKLDNLVANNDKFSKWIEVNPLPSIRFSAKGLS